MASSIIIILTKRQKLLQYYYSTVIVSDENDFTLLRNRPVLLVYKGNTVCPKQVSTIELKR